MGSWGLRLSGGVVAALAAATVPAAAHHVMDGKLPATVVEGLLSGLGHPVIGPDHLAFIVAIGIAAAMVPAGGRVIGAFIAATMLGVLAHIAALDVPVAEVLVAGSVVAAGGLVALGRGAGSGRWLVLSVIAGLLHGYAFGEPIAGAAHVVAGAYLVGLATVTAAVGLGVAAGTRRVMSTPAASARGGLAAGAVLGIIGLTMVAGSLVVV